MELYRIAWGDAEYIGTSADDLRPGTPFAFGGTKYEVERVDGDKAYLITVQPIQDGGYVYAPPPPPA